MIDPPQKGPRWARDAVNAATARNTRRGSPAQFSLEDLCHIWDKSAGRCAVSGLEVSFERVGAGQAQRPFAPSLDRIDPTKPYSRENVRVVAQVANFAMNAWGLQPLHRLAQGILRINGPFTGPPLPSVGAKDEPIVDEPLPIGGKLSILLTSGLSFSRNGPTCYRPRYSSFKPRSEIRRRSRIISPICFR
jgi:hypothetical protein